MNEFLKRLFTLPIITPVILIYGMYVIIMIYKQSNETELMFIENEEDLMEYVKPHIDRFWEKYGHLLMATSILVWLLIIKYIITITIIK
jgi:hypothetical protein